MLCLLPRRAPFSDWLAQVERILERHAHRLNLKATPEMVAGMRGCYDVGLTPHEVAADLINAD